MVEEVDVQEDAHAQDHAQEVVEDITTPEPSQDAATQEIEQPIYTKRDMTAKIKYERERALEQGRKKALAELEQQAASQAEQQTQAHSSANAAGLTPEDVEKLVGNALGKYIQQAETNVALNTLHQKLEAAREEFPNVMADIQGLRLTDEIALVIKEASNYPHTAAMLDEILNDGSKLSHYSTFAAVQPHKLAKEMRTLNDSIEANKKASTASKSKQLSEPFTQLSPSHQAVIGDNDSVSISQLRKDPRLKF